MVAARTADFKALLDGHNARLAALPGMDPLPPRPTVDQLRTYDRQHTTRRDALLASCVSYKESVRAAVENHTAEEDALRERRMNAAAESPPVDAK